MLRAGDIRRNVLLKFKGLCMETPCLCPSEGHKYGGRKLTKTYVIELCYKTLVVVFCGLIDIYMTVQIEKISANTYATAFSAVILISCHEKLYQTENM